MSKRTIRITVFLVMSLFDKKTKTYVRDTYSEALFTFTTEHASERAKPEELVTDSMIHARLNDFFERQEALPQLKEQYPTLPDFFIASGKLFSQEVFFEDIT